MHMSESEITRKFRTADNRREMLRVLADLNVCEPAEMKKYLLEHGFTEDDFRAKRGRRKKMDKDTVAVEVHAEGEFVPPIEPIMAMEPIRTVAQLMEMPELTVEEQAQVDRACAIPEPVRRVVSRRIEELTAQVMELERERDTLCDYLEGAVTGCRR